MKARDNVEKLEIEEEGSFDNQGSLLRRSGLWIFGSVSELEWGRSRLLAQLQLPDARLLMMDQDISFSR